MALIPTPIECVPLDAPPADWASVDAAFAALPAVPLVQSWRGGGLEPGFRPASARFAYAGESLFIKVDMEDEDVFNPVTQFNEPAYMKGDVVEVFLRAGASPYYCEIHSTPGGALLQLRFRADQRRVPLPPVASPVAQVLTRRTKEGWSACLQIPPGLPAAAPRPGAQWAAAVCRYDHTRGAAAPVLSSTAPFTQRDFHRLEEWNPVVFK